MECGPCCCCEFSGWDRNGEMFELQQPGVQVLKHFS
jgi:hypothetical protein